MTESYVINIANMAIKVVFEPAKDCFLRDFFIQQWKRAFSLYISLDNGNSRRTICLVESTSDDFSINKNIISIPIAQKKGLTFVAPYHISLQQFYWILTQVVLEEISKKGGFYLHCSGINTEKGVILFLSPSGGGKSTIVRLLHEHYPALVDDQAIIASDKGQYVLYQMFIPEKNEAIKQSIKKYNIYKLFFLKQSQSISQTRLISKAEIMRRIGSQLTTNVGVAQQTMKNLIKFVRLTSDYSLLEFNQNKLQLNRFFQQTIYQDGPATKRQLPSIEIPQALPKKL